MKKLLSGFFMVSILSTSMLLAGCSGAPTDEGNPANEGAAKSDEAVAPPKVEEGTVAPQTGYDPHCAAWCRQTCGGLNACFYSCREEWCAL